MKKLKNLFIVLIVSGLLSAISIDAAYMFKSYLGVSLKAFNAYTSIGTEYKIDGSKGQEYYNTGNINECTGNENKITVKIVCIGQNIPVKTLGSMQTAKWNDNAAKICSRYNLEIKNNVTSPCKSTHSGIWTHN